MPVDERAHHGAADNIGLDISARQVMRFPTDAAGAVADEQREVPPAGNDVFTHFRSTGPQSRLNFPGHLRAGEEAHTVNDAAPGLMRRMKLPGRALSRLMSHRRRRFADGDEWRAHLAEPGIDRMKGKPRTIPRQSEKGLIRCRGA